MSRVGRSLHRISGPNGASVVCGPSTSGSTSSGPRARVASRPLLKTRFQRQNRGALPCHGTFLTCSALMAAGREARLWRRMDLHDEFQSSSPATAFGNRTHNRITEFHAGYYLRPRLWLSFDSNFWSGGNTVVNGKENDHRGRNSRLGGTISVPLTKHQSLKFSASTGVRVGGVSRTLRLNGNTRGYRSQNNTYMLPQRKLDSNA